MKVSGFDFDEARGDLPATKLELYLVSRALMNYVMALQIETMHSTDGEKANWKKKRSEAEKMFEDLTIGLITQGGTKLDGTDTDD